MTPDFEETLKRTSCYLSADKSHIKIVKQAEIPSAGEGDEYAGAVGYIEAAGTVGAGAVEEVLLLHKLKSADMLLNIVCTMGFEARLRLDPSPPKLPLKLRAETLPKQSKCGLHQSTKAAKVKNQYMY